MSIAIKAAERGWLPDPAVRAGIRHLLKKRIQQSAKETLSGTNYTEQFAQRLRQQPLAPLPDKANEQHYEVPSSFFEYVLGPRLKYSSCYWPEGTQDLVAAEQEMLRLTCERAQLKDGMEILELGCGWGSLSLWMAEQYPSSRIMAVSNSATQRKYIEMQCKRRGIDNLKVVTADMNDFQSAFTFDRIVSVEMFEHMRNYHELFSRISRWLKSDGKLFVHIFCHREVPYMFETGEDNDWMARYFFTGGIMPSNDLFSYFQQELTLEKQWKVNGTHYAKTLEAWLHKMDAQKRQVITTLDQAYGAKEAEIWFQRWRIFMMACSELFAYHEGEEWWVSHYLFHKKPS